MNTKLTIRYSLIIKSIFLATFFLFISSNVISQVIGNPDFIKNERYEFVETVTVQRDYAFTGVGQKLIVLNISGSASPVEVGSVEISGGQVEDIKVTESKAYIAAGGAGLRVMDISEPANPKEIGFFNTSGYTEGVIVRDHYAYVADGGAGMRVIDISDPAKLKEVGFVYIQGFAFDLEVVGNYAYVAGAGAGLRIVDISNPIHPVEVGGYDTQGYTYGLFVVGSMAYIADGWKGFRVIDVSNPRGPIEIGYCKTPGWAFDIVVEGNIAYVADAFAGVRMVDVSNQNSPVEIGAYDQGMDVHDIAVIDEMIYAADRKGSLRIIQVSTPKHPTQLGFCKLGNVSEIEISQKIYSELKINSLTKYLKHEAEEEQLERIRNEIKPREKSNEMKAQIGLTPVGQIGGPTQAVAVKADYAYVGIGLRMEVLDVSDLTNLQQVGSTKILNGFITDITIAGNYAYVTIGGKGLWVIDISDPIRPNELGFLNTPGFAESVAVDGNFAYVASGGAGLRVIDVSQPANPKEISYVYTQGYAFDVKVVDNIAYIASAGSGLRIVDVSDPPHPTEVGGYDTPGYAQGVAVVDNLVYIADGEEGLRVLDVSNPTQPKEVSFYVTPGQAFSVVVSGTIAYIADAFNGVRVIDVSYPLNPIEIGAYKSEGDAHNLYVNGNIVYVTQLQQGLRVVNMEDPAHAKEVGLYIPLDDARRVTVAGSYAYVAAGFSGLRVVDVTDPNHPTEVGAFDTQGGFASSVIISGTFAYLATYLSGPYSLYVLDISDPTNPIKVGSIHTDGAYREIALVGQIVYVADEWGLRIISVSDPTTPEQIGFIRLNDKGQDTVGITVSGTLAFLADALDGVKIVDVSNPFIPRLVGIYDTPGFTLGVAVASNRAYIADAQEGLRVIDISNPNSPVEMGFYDTPGVAVSVTISDTIVYVSDGGGGIQIVDVSNPLTATLIGAYDTQGYACYTTLASNYVYVANGHGGLLILENAGKQKKSAGNLLVTSTADNGAGTLRQALLDAAPEDTIVFDPSVFPPASPMAITLSSQLPPITQGKITIDGSNAGVILDGSQLSGTSNGFVIMSNDNVVMGLQILRFRGAGVIIDPGKHNVIGGDRSKGNGPIGQGNVISGNDVVGIALGGEATMNNTIIGNFIGTDYSGKIALANEFGIFISGDASYNNVGGLTPTERNIISGNRRDGINMIGDGVIGNFVFGNYIGTDVNGASSLGNGQRGIEIELSASQNIVGGSNPVERNIISGNKINAIGLADPGTSYNTVIGNFIGTDATGTIALGNHFGIAISTTSFNRIGGMRNGERNVISGNNGCGISIDGLGLSDNLILGNYIGTDVTGTMDLGNGTGVSINVGTCHNFVGGTSDGERNVISGNGAGISISDAGVKYNWIAGNYIGTDFSGTVALSNYLGILIETASNNYIGPGNIIACNEDRGVEVKGNFAIGNTITRNSITNNMNAGIKLTEGGNTELTPPVIASVTSTSVSGTAPPNCTVEIFSDLQDEGKVYEGTTSSDSIGTFRFTSPNILIGPNITSTVTDKNGNTSEFSIYIPTTVEGNQSIPSAFELYPNPFNQVTTIKYMLSNPDHVTIKIYDLIGQEVETLINDFRTTGEYEITWQPGKFSSGIYFCRLQAGAYTETKKLVLQK